MSHESFSAPLEIKSLEKAGSFSGYASVFNVMDAQRDALMPGAFQGTLKKWEKKQRMPFLLWQHDMKQPIGFWESIQEDERGLCVSGQLLLDLQQAREAYSLMKAGVLEGLSIGFFPIIASKRGKDTPVRKIFQVDLVEISLVTQAANPLARLENVKHKVI